MVLPGLGRGRIKNSMNRKAAAHERCSVYSMFFTGLLPGSRTKTRAVGWREADDVGRILEEELTEHANGLDCRMDEGKSQG